MDPSSCGVGQGSSVYVVQIMVVKPATNLGNSTSDRWRGDDLQCFPLTAPPDPPDVIYTSDELDQGGVFQRAFAFQASGEWLNDSRFSGEYVGIRRVEGDEIFVSDTETIILKPDSIIALPGCFACEAFALDHAREYDNAMEYLEQAALDALLAAVGDDYSRCFGCPWPDELVDIAAKELEQIDLTTADHTDIMSLATSIISQLPPPGPPA